MSAYDESPPDEGYSEDPLTIRTSQLMPSWMVSMSVPERTGKGSICALAYSEGRLTTINRIRYEHHCSAPDLSSCRNRPSSSSSIVYQFLSTPTNRSSLAYSWLSGPSIS